MVKWYRAHFPRVIRGIKSEIEKEIVRQILGVRNLLKQCLTCHKVFTGCSTK